ncbi:MAG: amino acid ABC transporter permease [Acidimicrobiales bacterium]|nr:amino acid ABC transporter permease [Acidimicrobiales bacterium]
MDGLLLESHQYDLLLEGAWITIQILVYAFVLGVALSLVMGVARLSERRWIRGAALVYVEFFRGISTIVLLFIVAIAIPILFDLSQVSLLALGVVALGANMGGYGAEIVRGSILAIPRGQSEASIALNLSNTQRLRHVVLPQAMRIILPPFGNLTIEILKGTALVSLVGLADITQAGNFIRQQQLFTADGADRTVLFLNILVLYFVLAQIVNGLFRLGERRLERKYAGGAADLGTIAEVGK